MSTVKISNIKKVAKGELKIEDLGIEVKKFIPIALKENIAQVVISGSSQQVQGLPTISYSAKQIYTEVGIVRRYSNVDFSTVDKVEDVEKWQEAYFDFYDLLSETGIVDCIISQIPEKELKRTMDIIENEIAQVERFNTSTAVVVNKVFNKVIDELDKFINLIPKGIDGNLDINNVVELFANKVGEVQNGDSK